MKTPSPRLSAAGTHVGGRFASAATAGPSASPGFTPSGLSIRVNPQRAITSRSRSATTTRATRPASAAGTTLSRSRKSSLSIALAGSTNVSHSGRRRSSGSPPWPPEDFLVTTASHTCSRSNRSSLRRRVGLKRSAFCRSSGVSTDSSASAYASSTFTISPYAVGIVSADRVTGNHVLDAPSSIARTCSSHSAREPRWGSRPRHRGIVCSARSPNACERCCFSPQVVHCTSMSVERVPSRAS